MPASTPGLPDFVILGAQKSASTFLQDQMDQHPAVEIAAGESRHFEDPEYGKGAVAELPALFTAPGPVVRGIKRPDYLGRPEVPERLARHLPGAQLFVVLREPVARAVSAYYHYVRHGFVPLMPLDTAFAALLRGDLAAYPRAAEILSYGLYGTHIERYLSYFDAGQVTIFDQGDLISRPAESVRAAFEAIGVDPAFTPGRAPVSNRGVYSPLRLRVLRAKNRTQFRYTPELDRRYPRRPGPLGYLWAGGVITLDRRVLAPLDRTRPPKLPPALAREVRAYYADDAARLGALLPRGSSLSWLEAAR